MIDPFLRVTGGPEDARHVPLAPLAVCRLGRSPGNDVVLTDGAASREHAMVRRDASGECFLIDSGSRNGTVLNGRPVTAPTRLNDGDVIAIGRQELHFSDPGAAAMRLAAQPADAAAGPEATMFLAEQSLITVLVIDIRGFTPLSREIGEERISAVMTALFRRAGAMLDAAHCWSQKFIGDAVMAVWRHGGDKLLSSELGAVLDIVMRLEREFEDIEARFALPRPLRFGGAINTGLASIGNMGSGNSADFTALGDTVNKTFRMETASKDLDADLVIGEATLKSLAPPLDPTTLPRGAQVTLKGYEAAQPVRLLRFAEIAAFRELVVG